MKHTVREIPKIELHCHLDGSVSRSYLRAQAKAQNISIDIEKTSVDTQCQSLDEYLESFDEILKVMQTEKSLIDSVIDVVSQVHHDGVKYIELRFAPKLHLDKGLSMLEVMNATVQGAMQAEATYPVVVRLLVCGMKHHSNEENIEVFQHIHTHPSLQKYIVGVDLAGGEEDEAMSTFAECIAYAKAHQLNLTLHAGECGCNKNVYDAIKLGAQRIGHGVSALKDMRLLETLKNEEVLLEICPCSNLQTKAVQHIAEIDIPLLKKLDVPFLINTDNRGVTQTNLVQEYLLLLDNQLLTLDDIPIINKKALKYAFVEPEVKSQLRKAYFNG
ncbi:adenosine deaminase [Staphylococcus americanisciuri]|uniref:adenosine deaminase n=1 Tax=Staphylococcus americanisciuri TaxID=2973940 RepID=A0ABT2EZX4_9STAP|nr:adenosine deaminase [Staphylococcus americanisciuri]MCS4485753.1 adenosine deaminase [Staphylococcus americanisciuri]